ncbi:phenylacetate--CoA ligase family protein [Luedemannella flava]|uniref:Phenylacetate--CoA ligase family protein n=1 Tax=Luedemannella flava TaxID=349316 RepID=A0ABN2LZZ0_9ACTN
MDLPTIARVLWLRRALRQREGWSREQVRLHQHQQLTTLRDFALRRSPFYRRFHRGLAGAPLDALPVLTKTTLMDHFDELATDPAVRLAGLNAYLEGLTGDELFDGRFWVSATSGSSGRRSVIASDAREWAMTIASYGRANEWAGVRAGPLHHVRMAVVSSTTPWHQSARVAATVRSPFVATERFDAAAPISDIVAGLNAMRPHVLVGYASMIRVLAEEQLAGRLRITPRGVNASSEVLTAHTRALATRAWGIAPFNVYAATETGGIAAECREHQGLHLFEDLVVAEVVDDAYRPVPPGQAGDRLLVTVLSSRTVPLIRYELTDRVRLAARACPCPLPLRLLETVEGRTDDVLTLPATAGGTVRIHPVVFHQALDLIPAAGWQVRHEPGQLRVLIAAPGRGFDAAETGHRVAAALMAAGVAPPPVNVTTVDSIPTGAAGKRPLVVALPSEA